MKIESLLVNYLYTNKKLSLQGIGTFTVVGNIEQPEGDAPVALPEDAVVFEQDMHAPLDEGMIQYIVESTRKIKPLATSDLESFSILSKEYLNIGKPLYLEGFGTLQKNQEGRYEFFGATYINPRIEYAGKEIKEKDPGEISFRTPPRKNDRNKQLTYGIILLLILFMVPALIFYYYREKPVPEVATENLITPGNDSPKIQKAIPVEAVAADTLRYLVIKTYADSIKAKNEINRLSSYNHKVTLRSLDSTTHHVIMPFNKTLSDTTAIKDSINRFFGVKSWFLQ